MGIGDIVSEIVCLSKGQNHIDKNKLLDALKEHCGLTRKRARRALKIAEAFGTIYEKKEEIYVR